MGFTFMFSINQFLTYAVVSAGLLSVMGVLFRRHKTNGDVLFAIFAGSVAMAMLRPSLESQPGWLLWAVTLAGCATCNMYWLVSRNLFRGESGVQRVHLAVAISIALLIMGYRMAVGISSNADSEWPTILGALLTLASSAVLVLAFVEALRGWSPSLPITEKRLRVGFMVVFGSCVLLSTISGALVEHSPKIGIVRNIIVNCSALLIIVFTHYFLHLRRQQTAQVIAQSSNSPSIANDTRPEDLLLADSIRHQLEVLHVFREPELKVADLAVQLNTAEYRASRVITQVLGERNFNQMINRYRIAHACKLLEVAHSSQSILDISLECGFASLGPFNRAFKAAMGVTPSAYRASIKVVGTQN